ncbi:MAG: hypothetical protein WAT19_04640, partial [Ferruginibacter sp.]
MKKYLLLLSILFAAVIDASSQNMQWGWSKSYGTASSEQFIDIAADSRNGVYSLGNFSGPITIDGQIYNSNGGTDLILMKHDTTGSVVWVKTFGGVSRDSGISIKTDWQGNVIICGYYSNSISFGSFVLVSAGGTDGFICKLTTNGNVVWAKSLGSTLDEINYAIGCDQQNNIYTTGTYSSTTFSFANTILNDSASFRGYYGKMDPNGNEIWVRKISANANFYLKDLFVDKNRPELVITGQMPPSSIVNFTSNWNSLGIQSLMQCMFWARISTSGQVLGQLFVDDRTTAGGLCLSDDGAEFFSASRNFLSYLHVSGRVYQGPHAPLPSTIASTSGYTIPDPIVFTFANDLAMVNNSTLFVVGGSSGLVDFRNGYGTPPPNNQNAAYIWRIDRSAYTTTDLLNAPLSGNFTTKYQAVSVDTFSNLLFACGNFAGTTPGQYTLGTSILSAQGGFDGLITKVYPGAVNTQLNYILLPTTETRSICMGDSVVIGNNGGAFGGTPPYTYSWSPSIGLATPNLPSTMASPSDTTTYTLTITDAAQNSISKQVNVIVLERPATPVIFSSASNQICQGGSLMLGVSNFSNFSYYYWSNGQTGPTVNITNPGNYVLSAYGTNNCSSEPSDTFVVTASNNLAPAPPLITASGPVQFCQGSSVTLTSGSSSGNFWNTGATTQSITVNTTGNYFATTTVNGCTSAPSVVQQASSMYMPPAPTISAIGSTQLCPGDSVILVSSSSTENLWSTGATTPFIVVRTSGSYSLRLVSGSCISQPSPIVNVSVLAAPQPTITALGPLQFCAGSSVTLTSSSPTGNLWSNGATTQSIIVNQSGNYSVTATNSSGCVSLPSVAATVTANPLPPTPVITANGPLSFCEGGSVQLTSTSANEYLWSNAATTQTITATTAGNYSVVTSNSAGCSSAPSNMLTVTVNPLPAT